MEDNLFYSRVLIALIFGVVVGLLAKRKNRDALFWGLAGVISWVFALVVLAFMPYLCKKCGRRLTNEQGRANQCPVCDSPTAESEQRNIEKENARITDAESIGQPRLLRIVREPNLTAPRNIESWSKIKACMASNGFASFDELAEACREHRHEAGGVGFVNYCIDNGWLSDV